MPCFSPLLAWQGSNGDVVFSERARFDIVRELSLPCGQCIGCRLERSRQWAMRCLHESSLYDSNCFVTLTYDDEHYPKRGRLEYRDFQLFMKRLRKRFDERTIRFYMCGEYGPENWRPHFHACLFNLDFSDKVYWANLPSGSSIYRSGVLEELWPFGFTSVGEVTFESAAYIARYCVQKITGDMAELHYRREDADGVYQLPPEFNQMSRMPGVGRGFLEKYGTDIYPHDYVIVNGTKVKPPKYYDRLFSKEFPEDFEELQFKRELDGRSRYNDNTPERLAVKSIVTRARAAFLKRGMEDGFC